MSVDDIWDILVEVINISAKQTIPQRRQGGEPCPPKEEIPLNQGVCLLGSLLCSVATLNGCGGDMFHSWQMQS